jgi:hypothetical protein
MAIKGTSLDTRLQHCMLLDPRLQRRLNGDQFRAFINLKVWVVSRLSDGAFKLDDTEMIPNIEPKHIDYMTDVGVVERDDDGNYRIHPDYWGWQTSNAELAKMDDKRKKDRERKAEWRAKKQEPDADACEQCGQKILNPEWGKYCSEECYQRANGWLR